MGPVAAKVNFLQGSVLEGVWILLERIPTSGRLWCCRNSVAAVAEWLQLRAAMFCVEELQREGEIGEQGVVLCG
jgi:hypothetical protein